MAATDAASSAAVNRPFSFTPPSFSPSNPDPSNLFLHLNTLLLSSPPSTTQSYSTALHSPSYGSALQSLNLLPPCRRNKKAPVKRKGRKPSLLFSSTTLSASDAQNVTSLPSSPSGWLKPSTRDTGAEARSLMKAMSLFERTVVGAVSGGMAGAFTYVCLLPIDAVKTKLQTKGAAQIYASAVDAAVHIFRDGGFLGFYRGISAVIVGSAFSSGVYFGTCELGKSLLSKFPTFPPLLIPPTAGAMGNIVSSAIMVPKELITQRMQAGAAGRSWDVLLRILEKDGILGLYAGYSATLLRNLPAGILSYSSFEYLKAFVLRSTGQSFLEPAQSICCGALAGAISASLTTPLDVVKTRLMTQVHGEAATKISETVRQILLEEGWLGLTRGIGPRVLHSACFAAIGYCAFETARLTLLNQYLLRKEQEVKIASS